MTEIITTHQNRDATEQDMKLVLSLLMEHEVLSPQEIMDLASMEERRAKYIIRQLLDRNLISKRPNLLDMRCVFYCLK